MGQVSMIESTDTVEQVVVMGAMKYPAVAEKLRALHNVGLSMFRLFMSEPLAQMANDLVLRVPAPPEKMTADQRDQVKAMSYRDRTNPILEDEADDNLRLLVATMMRRDLAILLRSLEQRVLLGSVRESVVMDALRDAFKANAAIRKVMSNDKGKTMGGADAGGRSGDGRDTQGKGKG